MVNPEKLGVDVLTCCSGGKYTHIMDKAAVSRRGRVVPVDGYIVTLEDRRGKPDQLTTAGIPNIRSVS